MIDVHAHLFFEELLEHAGNLGPRIERSGSGCHLVTGGMRWPLPNPSALTTTPAQRVAALDEAGIDLQIVTISPLWLFHHAPAEIAEPFAAAANDLIADWCARTGGRAAPLAQLPAQRPDRAAAELRRCVEQLGMLGGYIGSDARPGLDDKDLDELYAACEDLDVPLFVHAAMPGIDGPPGDPRLDRWIGQAVIGYPLEDTVAVTTFLLSDVLERHPTLDVCFSHGGGAVPFLWGRLSAFAGSAASPVSPDGMRRRLHRLWFDTHVHSTASTGLLRDIADSGRLVFGSNFGGWDSETAAAAHGAEATTNARRLLRLPADDAPADDAPADDAPADDAPADGALTDGAPARKDRRTSASPTPTRRPAPGRRQP